MESFLFEFKESPIHGNGIFTTEDIPADTRLFQTHVIDSTFAPCWANIKPNCMYNHSVRANCASITEENYKLLVSIRNIERGEELLVDFDKDKDLEQPQEGWI